jgi:hypothetical protein
MAIVKGRKLNNSQKLEAVAADDDRAASEYAHLSATLSDDWGRFKMSPRRILADAYEYRPKVNELMVGDWLAIYEKHQLLRTYTVDGRLWAEWTNWQGQAPSQRRYHHAPEPPWSSHKHSGHCRLRGDSRSDPAADSPTPTRHLQPERPAVLAIPLEPVVPAVPAVPVETDIPSGLARAPASPFVAKGQRPTLELEALRLCREIGQSKREAAEDVMARHSEHKGRSKLNPANMTDDRLLHTLRSLRAEHSQLRAPPPEPDPLELAATWVRERGGPIEVTRRFVEWLEANRLSGETERVAFGRWVGEDFPAFAYSIIGSRIYHALRAKAPA